MKVQELTIFRFVAALIVVIFHFGIKATGATGVLASGPEMVTFFFVLSGFVMTISNSNKDKINIKLFYWARISKIVPIYLFVIIIRTLSLLVHDFEVDWLAVLLNVLFIQSWFPEYARTINSPGWSLSAEVFFYLIFPFVFSAIRRHDFSPYQLILGSVCFWLATQIVLSNIIFSRYNLQPSTFLYNLIYFCPLSHLCSFLLGIAGGIWFTNNNKNEISDYYTLSLTLIALLLIVYILNNSILIQKWVMFPIAFSASFLAPIFLVFIIFLSLCQSNLLKILAIKPFILLGESSYSLYILHWPLHDVFEGYSYLYESFSHVTQFYIYLICSITLSILIFLYVEKPVTVYLRQLLQREVR